MLNLQLQLVVAYSVQQELLIQLVVLLVNLLLLLSVKLLLVLQVVCSVNLLRIKVLQTLSVVGLRLVLLVLAGSVKLLHRINLLSASDVSGLRIFRKFSYNADISLHSILQLLLPLNLLQVASSVKPIQRLQHLDSLLLNNLLASVSARTTINRLLLPVYSDRISLLVLVYSVGVRLLQITNQASLLVVLQIQLLSLLLAYSDNRLNSQLNNNPQQEVDCSVI